MPTSHPGQLSTLRTLDDYQRAHSVNDEHAIPPGVLTERFEELDRPERAALFLIMAELQRAKAVHPRFAKDAVHAAAILCEEAGETARAAIDHYYAGGDVHHIADEAIQTAAVALRLVLELHKAGSK